VAIVGAGEAGAHVTLTSRPSITQGWARQSAKRAFAMAGLAPRDMEVAQLYDCYTIAVLILIEELGFCPGQGGAFIAEHGLVHDGGFPCNTNGGQLSFSQPGGGGGMILVVEGARHGLVQGNGGVMPEEVTLILSNAARPCRRPARCRRLRRSAGRSGTRHGKAAC
jgi:acetyl-CoA C-acetyltransferase